MLRIFTRESRLEWKLDKLAELGFEGFTLLRGIAGYGTDGGTDAGITVESVDLPVVVEIFTTYGRFKKKQNLLRELVRGLITLERANLDP